MSNDDRHMVYSFTWGSKHRQREINSDVIESRLLRTLFVFAIMVMGAVASIAATVFGLVVSVLVVLMQVLFVVLLTCISLLIFLTHWAFAPSDVSGSSVRDMTKQRSSTSMRICSGKRTDKLLGCCIEQKALRTPEELFTFHNWTSEVDIPKISIWLHRFGGPFQLARTFFVMMLHI